MLLELAIGDAYGAGFEFADPQIIKEHNNLSQYIQHPLHKLKPGSYTDDTQMSLAIAEIIISQQPWTPENLANKFVEVFKRDPREGYSRRFYEFLQKIETGQQFLEQITWTSDKSGAAMRSAPIGIFSTPQKVIEACKIQAAITHNTPDGINAACAAALMSHYFLYNLGEKKDLGKFLETQIAGNWTETWQGEVNTKGISCVKAAITALMRNNTMSELLKDCINFTGDVDTVAAIALAAGASSQEINQNLPQHLINNLENNTYGKDYLINSDTNLLNII